MQQLWLVRLGRNSEFEAAALEDSVLTIGFNITDDLKERKSRDDLLRLMENLYPNSKPASQRNFAAQVNQFVNTMKVGDIVVSPLRTSGKIAIGEVTGSYRQDASGRPIRPVKWLRRDVDRTAFKQDLLFSFGAIMTVCEVKRNDALKRVLTVAATGVDGGDGGKAVLRTQGDATGDLTAETGEVDLEVVARDQIERRIASSFAGHDFTRLIAAILQAQGYVTRVSPPGPDNGVDILAGRGATGFESPRIVVQVKSGDTVVDQPTLQSLIGCIADTHADQGLIVSWSGFKSTVERRTNELFFRVRLWGREEIVTALFNVYEALPEEIRAELPLRRTWTLVPDESAS